MTKKVPLSKDAVEVVVARPQDMSKHDMAGVVGARLSDNLPPELAAKLEAAGITAEDRAAMAQAVIDGQKAVTAGDPLGTVRKSPTGEYYIRVESGGVHKWRVVDPHNGDDNTFDMQAITHPIVAEGETNG